jgi:hypothetical protein
MKTKTTTSRQTREEVIDELGMLEMDILRMKPKVERAKVLKLLVQSWGVKLDAEASAIYDGYAFSVELSSRDYERAISDMEQLFRLFGKKKFLALCAMTLKNIDANLTPEESALVVTKERTGSRTVRVMQRAA